MRMALMLLASLAALSAPAFSGDCPADGATYQIGKEPGFTFSLAKSAEQANASDLSATLKTPTRHWDFDFTASNGYSFNYLLPRQVSEAEEDGYRIYFWDEAFQPLDIPQSSGKAPAYVFAPEIGLSLWYGVGEREFLPIAMWRLQPCRR
jgi:hypothetical protein